MTSIQTDLDVMSCDAGSWEEACPNGKDFDLFIPIPPPSGVDPRLLKLRRGDGKLKVGK